MAVQNQIKITQLDKVYIICVPAHSFCPPLNLSKTLMLFIREE